MDLQNHEKWIKEQLADRKANVDSNEMWAALEQYVPEQKSRRKGIFLWFLAGILLFGGVGAVGTYLYTNDNEIFEEQFVEAIEIENEELVIEVFEAERQKGYKNKQEIALNTTQGQAKSSNSEMNNKVSYDRLQVNSPTNSSRFSINKNLSPNIDFEHDGRTSTNTNDRGEKSLDNGLANTIAIPSQVLSNINEPIANEEQFGSFNSAFLQSNSFTKILSNDRVLAMPKVEMAKSKAPLKIYLGLFTGVNYSVAKIQNRNSSEYAQFISDHKKTVPSISFGLHLSAKLSDHWTIHTNYQFDQLVSRLELGFFEEYQVIEGGIESILITNEGALIQGTAPIEKWVSSYSEGIWYEKTNQHSAQIALSYAIISTKRWSANLGGGIHCTLSSAVNGNTVSDEYTIVSFIESGYSNSISTINPLAISTINYQLNRNTRIGIYASYRPTTIEILTTSNSLKTNSHIGNIGLTCQYGIR